MYVIRKIIEWVLVFLLFLIEFPYGWRKDMIDWLYEGMVYEEDLYMMKKWVEDREEEDGVWWEGDFECWMDSDGKVRRMEVMKI